MSQGNVWSGGDFAQHDESYFFRRSGTFILVASLHALLFYGLVTTLSHTHARLNPDDLQNQRVDTPHASAPLPALPPPPSIPPHVATQVQGGPGVGFPDPDDFYPSQARRLEEQGSATVRVCVDTNGRLTSDPAVQQGSGSARLDEGAIKLARAGSGHYRASREDGRPVNSCYALRIRFQIRN